MVSPDIQFLAPTPFPSSCAFSGKPERWHNNSSNTGAQFLANTSNGNVAFQIANGSGSLALNAATNLGAVVGAWQFFAVSVNEAGNVIRYRNGTSASSSGVYTSPSASAPTHTLGIGQLGNGQSPIANTGRIAQAMFWDVTLTWVDDNARVKLVTAKRNDPGPGQACRRNARNDDGHGRGTWLIPHDLLARFPAGSARPRPEGADCVNRLP